MPYFTVVIPVYNAEKSLDRCLQSVYDQSFTDYEVIAINDGSSDGSQAILTEWQKRFDGKLNFRNQQNKGLGNARNRAIQMANSEVVALLDADDSWEKNKLAELHKRFSTQADLEAAFHKMRVIGNGYERVRPIYSPKNIEQLLLRGNPIIPSAFAMRTELFRSYGFSEKKLFHGAEDLHLWIKLLLAETSFEAIHQCLGNYYEHSGMSSHMARHMRHIEAVLDYYKKVGDISASIHKKALARVQYEAARYYHKQGKFRQAADYYYAASAPGLKAKLMYLASLLALRL